MLSHHAPHPSSALLLLQAWHDLSRGVHGESEEEEEEEEEEDLGLSDDDDDDDNDDDDDQSVVDSHPPSRKRRRGGPSNEYEEVEGESHECFSQFSQDAFNEFLSVDD